MGVCKKRIIAIITLVIMILTHFNTVQLYAATPDERLKTADVVITLSSNIIRDTKGTNYEAVEKAFGMDRVGENRLVIDDLSNLPSGVASIKLKYPNYKEPHIYSIRQSVTGNGYPIYLFDLPDDVKIASWPDEVVQCRELDNGKDVIQIRSEGTGFVDIYSSSCLYYRLYFTVRK